LSAWSSALCSLAVGVVVVDKSGDDVIVVVAVEVVDEVVLVQPVIAELEMLVSVTIIVTVTG